MEQTNLLRKQVVMENRKRRIIFLTFVFLGFTYLVISFVFGDLGLLTYSKLHDRKARLEKQITEIEKENAALRSEVKSLKGNPYYREKYAREEFGLAKPDEYIFRYDDR
jgi:cell division protein FtsB